MTRLTAENTDNNYVKNNEFLKKVNLNLSFVHDGIFKIVTVGRNICRRKCGGDSDYGLLNKKLKYIYLLSA